MKRTAVKTKPDFAMVKIKDLQRMLELTATRDLQLRDGTLLLALISHTHTFSGRVQVTSRRLALDLGMTESDIRAGLARLIKHHMVRRVRNENTGELYYRLNPWTVSTTRDGSALEGLAQKEFMEA